MAPMVCSNTKFEFAEFADLLLEVGDDLQFIS